MPRTLGTAISDEDDLILHRASDLLDALQGKWVYSFAVLEVKMEDPA
jgi:hypothetical protein